MILKKSKIQSWNWDSQAMLYQTIFAKKNKKLKEKQNISKKF